MIQDDSPFASFQPSTEPPPAADKPTKKGGKKKADKPAAAPVAAVAPAEGASAPKKPRKRREKKVKPARELMLPLNAMLELGGLNTVEQSALAAIATSLQSVAKKSRRKIAAALAKIFA